MLARWSRPRFRFALDTAVTRDGAAAWTIDRARGAALAVNAGQFEAGSPWGWVVHGGVELQPPGHGPLSAALAVDREGRIELLEPDEMLAAQRNGQVLEAFQSYPAILVGDGLVPEPLRAIGRGVDLVHRDSRFGVCVRTNGHTHPGIKCYPCSRNTLLPMSPVVQVWRAPCDDIRDSAEDAQRKVSDPRREFPLCRLEA